MERGEGGRSVVDRFHGPPGTPSPPLPPQVLVAGIEANILYFAEGNGKPLQYSCLKNPWAEESGSL